MSKRGKIRCDECVYWGNPRPSKSTRGAMGDCHFSPPRNEDRFVPGYAIWPVTTEDDWCGQFKHPKITGDSRTALYRSLLNTTRPLTGAEMLDMIVASLRGYPNAGGDVEVMTEVDLEIDLMDTLPTVISKGTIRWVKQAISGREGKPPRYDTGIQFLTLKDECRKRIQGIVEHVLRKSK